MPPPGLCDKCFWHKEIRTDRGSVFIQCTRGLTDPAFVKYPRLPVICCTGYQHQRGESANTGTLS